MEEQIPQGHALSKRRRFKTEYLLEVPVQISGASPCAFFI